MFTRKQFHQFIPVFAALLLTVQTVHAGDDGKKMSLSSTLVTPEIRKSTGSSPGNYPKA